MKRIILERVEHCKLVVEKNVDNGHDCWGNTEWSSEYYVPIKVDEGRNKYERVFLNSGYVVIHDGQDVISVELVKYLPKQFRDLLETESEKRDRVIEDVIKK